MVGSSLFLSSLTISAFQLRLRKDKIQRASIYPQLHPVLASYISTVYGYQRQGIYIDTIPLTKLRTYSNSSSFSTNSLFVCSKIPFWILHNIQLSLMQTKGFSWGMILFMLFLLTLSQPFLVFFACLVIFQCIVIIMDDMLSRLWVLLSSLQNVDFYFSRQQTWLASKSKFFLSLEKT